MAEQLTTSSQKECKLVTKICPKWVAKLPCGLCTKKFSKENLTSEVTMKSIDDLRRSWKRRSIVVSSPLRQRYDTVKVCKLCYEMIKGYNLIRMKLNEKETTEDPVGELIYKAIITKIKEINASVELENVALHKKVMQSSTYYGYVPENAVNGSYEMDEEKDYSQTNEEDQPYWQIDLMKMHRIYSIEIWDRLDSDKIFFPCYILISSDPMKKHELDEYLQSHITFTKVTEKSAIRCFRWIVPGTALGRYVRIQIDAVTYLRMSQVRVMIVRQKRITT